MNRSQITPPLKVLLSDGAGVTGRQTAGLLHRSGHRVGVLTSDPLALTRFTRSVRWRHRTDGFGDRPIEWLDEALGAFHRGGYDVLLPTQEQVAVLAWAAGRGRLAGVATAVPPFESLAAVLDKAAAERTLDRFDVPRPKTLVLGRGDDPGRWDRYPAFVKRPVATASTGVVRVDTPEQVCEVLRRWDLDTVVVQEAVDGPLAMVQSVFHQGRLLAFHVNLRVHEGVRGGAGNKRSVALPAVREVFTSLGAQLSWNGGLSADVILSPDGPLVIDVNPRLVEPVNAARSGVDLVTPMVQIAQHDAGRGPAPAVQPESTPDVRTHQLLLNLLGAAQHQGTRRSVLDEVIACGAHRGRYHDSVEELTPPSHDWRTLLPIGVVATSLVLHPRTWERWSSDNVASYAIAPDGWATLTR
jgi:glutathione synthase/RimK-type ligase-like ATP-grasp enzyme